MDSIKELLAMKLPVLSKWDWMSSPASSYADNYDSLFSFILWGSVVLFLVVIVPMFWFISKYRRRTEDQKALSQVDHNVAIEVVWTLLPCVFLFICFVWGFSTYLDVVTVPMGAKNLRVVGQKWNWTVQYPEDGISVSGQGAIVGVPVDEDIEFTMSSQDVIHSFFLPNFRVKQDVLPGRYSSIWIKPREIGEFPIFCAEYCGDAHSNMLAVLKVMSRSDYNAWIDAKKSENNDLSPVELGKKLYKEKACETCHSVDGTDRIGPSFKGVYGTMQKVNKNGKIVEMKVDDSFIKEHILTPAKYSVIGYPPVMPAYQGQLSEIEIVGLIEFIKSLK